MSHWMNKLKAGVMVITMAGLTSLAHSTEPPTPDSDYSNWESIDFTSPDDGAETFLRSFTESIDGVLTNDIIESFWDGGDGFMYVNVVVNNTLVGSFRYVLSTDEPFSYPPSGDEWTPPSGEDFYESIPGVPEPGTVALALAGLALVGWTKARR